MSDNYRLPIFGEDASASGSASASVTSAMATGQYLQQFQSKVEGLPDKAKTYATTWIGQQTGLPVKDQRVAQGAASALDLFQNGFNPTSEDDKNKLIHAVSGGLALIVPIGTVVAAALESLWFVGQKIACPTEQFFASVGLSTLPPECGGKPCATSGNWTPESILSANGRSLPRVTKGSFAELVIGALAYYKAQQGNCKAGLPSSAIVDAIVNIWNQTHKGPSVPYLIPPIATSPSTIIVTSDNVSGSTPSAKAGKDPWAFYAFQPATLGQKESRVRNIADKNQVEGAFPISRPVSILGVTQYAPARIVMVNTGAVIPPPPNAKMVPFHLGSPAHQAAAIQPKGAPVVVKNAPVLYAPMPSSAPSVVQARNSGLLIAGGAVAGLTIAGPLGAAIGAGIGWGASKLFHR